MATHTLTVAAAPAAPPQTTPPAVTPAAPKQTITGVKITPRCLRADDLRAKIAKAQTMKVRFSLGTAAPVKFTLQRLSGKGGASKCPPTRGVKHPDGKRVPGVYRPFTNKSVNVAKGANTVTVAATDRQGQAPRAGHLSADRRVRWGQRPYEAVGAGELVSAARCRSSRVTSSRT